MPKPMKTELEKIQEGKGKEIARAFFLTYTTPSSVTKEIYKDAWEMRNEGSQKSFVMPIIQNYLFEWKRKRFIETSRIKIPIKVERKKGKPYNLHSEGYLMNLEPIYMFCKEKGVEFTDKEKQFLNLNLLSEHIRKEILEENTKDDIINATLKYYVKNTIMKYFFLLRDVRENKKKYKKQTAKAEKINNPKDKIGKEMKKAHAKIMKELTKKFGSKENKIIFDTIKVIAYDLPQNPSNSLFISYLNKLEDGGEFIPTLDNKMLMALQISPKENTPTEQVKKVLRPDRTLYHLDYFEGCDLSIPMHKSLLSKSFLTEP